MEPVKHWIQNAKILSGRPGLLLRGARNALSVAVGIPRLRGLDIAITNVCPCTCAHCYAGSTPQDAAPTLSVQTIVDVVQQARQLGALHINFTGGEPLLRRDLEQILSQSASQGLFLSICTSGAGLTPRRIRALSSHGLDAMLFSLDSADPAVHNASRGVPGLYQRVRASIVEAREAGMYVGVNAVAHRQALASGDLENLRQLGLEEGFVLNLTMPTASGRWHQAATEMLTPDERTQLAQLMQLPGVRTDTQTRIGPAGCPAIHEKMYIHGDGSVKPCQLLDASFGNIHSASLRSIWETMRGCRMAKTNYAFCPAADSHLGSNMTEIHETLGLEPPHA